MNNYEQADEIGKIVAEANRIVIIQAENPDGDSLGSALALEHILGDMGKETYLYCAVDMPTYLRYMSGWDRVNNELPSQFDAAVVVDASTMTLFEHLEKAGSGRQLGSKPCIVLDHHEIVDNPLPFATVTINDHKRASTGELIYMIARQLDWPVSVPAQECLMTSILGDTQGLTNELASSETYRVMAEFVENGVDRPRLEDQRREYGKMQPEIFRYKADLIKRTEYAAEGKIAYASVPQNEINQYSPLYNPAPLIQNDMLQTSGVQLAIVFKIYADGKITGAVRANPRAPIAAKLAETLGGGGHNYASGFKVTDGRTYEEVKTAALDTATKLLSEL